MMTPAAPISPRAIVAEWHRRHAAELAELGCGAGAILHAIAEADYQTGATRALRRHAARMAPCTEGMIRAQVARVIAELGA